METPQQELRNYWAKKFPGVSDECPYWWIEGDGYCLAVIDGNNLTAAVDMVDENWKRFSSIKAYTAKLLDDNIVRFRNGGHEISNREYSIKELENYTQKYIQDPE